MYKINYDGKEIIIGQKFALLVVEAVASDKEEVLVLEEVLEENQTTLKAYLVEPDRSRPNGHAKGWSSHCARCGAEGRKCLERLNGHCKTCFNECDTGEPRIYTGHGSFESFMEMKV